ncbi:hypothetical protein [Spiroplasma taiwanense]|uniref:Uncharacterized protein n=1 Tax=Spiroplasma taiwanense CT-1 TaxID=1276220 RepID=S5M0W6_9MOLU|nr:hypothetical protein [Spiroplasma taiwanense]AGR41647.1 hypothetical protein STAIW_v1c10640 [Spiroplasma taiwanense CT-1]
MSYFIKNAKFINKKVNPKVITFEALESNLTTVLSYDSELLKNFKNILQGKYSVKDGIFKIDNFDKVNKQWTNKRVEIIKHGLIFRKWPEKFWLYTSLLLNKDFYNMSKINYINDKYSYLSFSTSKNNETDLEMRKKIENMVSKFINSSIEIEEQWQSEFLDNIVNFNEINLEKEYPNLENYIKIIIKDYYYLVEKTLNFELFQTFLQNLWDKVYVFIELNSLCTCEYNAKKTKDKSIKKLSSQLNFHQINFVIRKQLKIIDLKVTAIKRKIAKNKFILKNLKKQILFEMGKFNLKYKKLKDLEEIFSWRKVAKDQVFEFRQKQEKIFFEGLADESTILKGKIVEIMHRYHKKILNNELEEGNSIEFKNKKNKLKKTIRSIYSQADSYIVETLKNLEISFDFISLKWKSINIILFKLLKAIYLKKYNIIFYNIFSKLTKEEALELVKAIENLKKINKKFSIIFLEKDLKNIVDLKSKINLLNDKSVIEIGYSELLKKYWNTYGNDFFHLGNMIPYSYDGKIINIFGEKVKIESTIFKNSGKILFDPFKIVLHKKESKNIIIQMYGSAKKIDYFNDKNIYEFTSNNNKLIFYSTEKLNDDQKINIYISEDSILEVL